MPGRRAFLGVTALSLSFMGASGSHPLHTTLTEVVQEAGSSAISITIRGFADDLLEGAGRFVGRDAGGLSPDRRDSAVATYLATRFSLVDRAGHRIALSWQGTRRTADVLWSSFGAQTPGGLRNARVSNSALCEIHDDQVNIVQFKTGGTTRSLLFTPGDGMKPVP